VGGGEAAEVGESPPLRDGRDGVVGGIRRAQGLRYAVVDTPEMRWLTWKELSDIEHPLDRALTQLCSKPRLLERVHAFIVFDAGVKKTATHNQYFGVKAAQERVQQREGGIIWHTQGSGKSLTMVWLAKWIREHEHLIDALGVHDGEGKVHAAIVDEVHDGGEPVVDAAHLFQRPGRDLGSLLLGQSVHVADERADVAEVGGRTEVVD
jgi:hypothetical protein